MVKRTILDFFGKSTVEIERDENNKSGIGGNICVYYYPQMCITCIGVWLYNLQKLPWKKGAHTELTCKNGYCKSQHDRNKSLWN